MIHKYFALGPPTTTLPAAQRAARPALHMRAPQIPRPSWPLDFQFPLPPAHHQGGQDLAYDVQARHDEAREGVKASASWCAGRFSFVGCR
jgi:hypothetical protein